MKAKKDGSVDSSEPMDPGHKQIKMDILKALHDHMGKMMGADVAGIKKVEVAAPDKMGLALGLDKAKEMVDPSEASEDPKEEASESPEMEASEDDESEEKSPEDMSSDELEAQIKKLQELKMKKMS